MFKQLGLIAICSFLTACGGGNNNPNPNNGNLTESGNSITTNNQVAVATGSYIVAQATDNAQTIEIPVYNNSPTSVNISLPTISTSPLNASLGSCNQPLPSGQSCAISVSLTNGKAGNGEVSIPLVANGNTFYTIVNWIRLTSPLTSPQLYVPSTPLIALANQPVYASLTFVNGNTQLRNVADTKITPLTNNGTWQKVNDSCGNTIAANASCSLLIKYTATLPLNSLTSIAAQVSKNGISNGLYALPLTTQGTAFLSGVPNSINLYNNAPAEVKLKLTNSGTIPIASIKVLAAPNINITDNSCNKLLTPLTAFNYGVCSMTLHTSKASGPQQLTISYTDTTGTSYPLQTSIINYDSLVTLSSPPVIVTLANQAVNESFTLQNQGTNSLTLAQNITLNPSNLGKFTQLSCPNDNFLLAAESTITCTATFKATNSAKNTQGVISLSATDDKGNMVTTKQTGTFSIYSGPTLIASKQTLSFNVVNGQMESKAFTLTNTGDVEVNNLQAEIANNALGFTVSSCNSLKANESCIVTLTYFPTYSSAIKGETHLKYTYNYSVNNIESSNSLNLIKINYQTTLIGPSINCSLQNPNEDSYIYYFGNPNSINLGTTFTCTNNGQDAAKIEWAHNLKSKLKNGFIDPLPITIAGGTTQSFTLKPNPTADNQTYMVNDLALTYTGVATNESGNLSLLSSLSYTTKPWINASLASNCNNVSCSIIVNNNSSSDAVSLEPITVNSHLTVVSQPCTNFLDSCTITLAINPAAFKDLKDGEDGTITIKPSQQVANQPLKYQFSYKTNEILYAGGLNSSGIASTNNLWYYEPYVDPIYSVYCYAGGAVSNEACTTAVAGNNAITALLYNPQNGGLIIGTTYNKIGGGAIYSYDGNGSLLNESGFNGTTSLGMPAASQISTCNNNNSLCSITSIALDSQGNVIAATPNNTYSYSNNEKSWSILGNANPANNTLLTQYFTNPLTSEVIATMGNFVYALINNNWNLISNLNAPILALTATENAIFLAINSKSQSYVQILNNPLTALSSHEITGVNNNDLLTHLQYRNGLLVATGSKSIYYAANLNFNESTTFQQLASLPSNQSIQSLALDANGDIYIGTNLGTLYVFKNSNSITNPNYNVTESMSYSDKPLNALTFGYHTSWY